MTREHEAEHDHRTDPEIEDVQPEEDDPGHADRDGNADPLDDRLHREALADRNDLERGVDRRAGRSIGRRDVGDAKRAGQHEEPETLPSLPRGDHGHHGEHDA